MLRRLASLLLAGSLACMTSVACAPEFTIVGAGGASASSTTSTTSSSGTITDAGHDASACETVCVEDHTAGYAAFVCDGLEYCGCMSTMPCFTQCGATMACKFSTTCSLELSSVTQPCLSCLETQYEMTSGCAGNAENTCKGNTDCAALLSCFAGCLASTSG